MLNKKIIIGFDGPDNVGKNTQIDKVREYFNKIYFTIINSENPMGKNNEEKLLYGSEMEKASFDSKSLLWKNNIPQMWDRTHFSEYAYRVFRDSDKIDDILKTEHEFLDLIPDTLIFIFIDEAENIIKRDDGESAYKKEDIENIKKLVERFEEISEKSVFENYIININEKNEDEVFEIVLEKISQKFGKIN